MPSPSLSSTPNLIDAEKFIKSLFEGQLIVIDPYSALNKNISFFAEADGTVVNTNLVKADELQNYSQILTIEEQGQLIKSFCNKHFT